METGVLLCQESWRRRDSVGRGEREGMDELRGRGSSAVWHGGGPECNQPDLGAWYCTTQYVKRVAMGLWSHG